MIVFSELPLRDGVAKVSVSEDGNPWSVRELFHRLAIDPAARIQLTGTLTAIPHAAMLHVRFDRRPKYYRFAA